MDVTIVDNEIDRQEMYRVMDAHADMINGKISKEEWADESRFPRKQWLRAEGFPGDLPFTVVDNRGGECFVEGFSTLDGAVLYICDCHITCEHQEDWDYTGSIKDCGGLDVKDGMLRREGVCT